jgi:hypothetical protein
MPRFDIEIRYYTTVDSADAAETIAAASRVAVDKGWTMNNVYIIESRRRKPADDESDPDSSNS